tara:strand:- start:599 stop:805 length:207 start_codon:yes stop_codon:yes gene_type:complete
VHPVVLKDPLILLNKALAVVRLQLWVETLDAVEVQINPLEVVLLALVTALVSTLESADLELTQLLWHK